MTATRTTATRATALIALAASALLLAGCASTPSSNGDNGGASSAPAADKAPLFSELPKDIQKSGEIIFGGDNHPPYRSQASDGGPITGIDPDFQRALEGQLGVKIKTEITSGLPALLTGMQSGRYHAFNGPVKATAAREADFDNVVWMTTRSSYVFLKENANKIPDSAALCGLKIAGVAGSVTEVQVKRLNTWCDAQGKKDASFVGLADTNSTVLAVQAGRVDAMATTKTAAIDIVKKTPDTFKYVSQTDEQGAGVDLMALLTPKDSGLGTVLFDAFQNLFDNGEYAKIMKKWGLESVMLDKPQLNPTVTD